MNLECIEFYEDELEEFETPSELKKYIEELHDEFLLYDITSLINYFKLVEKYEFCEMLKNFAIDNLSLIHI